jgi:Ca2+-binding EF-hand superfamily protein
MALAMGNIASMLITVGDPDEAEKTIAAKVTSKELRMMQRFELDDGDGQITRAEYILLCTVRLGALSPELIGKINERFKELDKSGDGTLSYAEILEHPEDFTEHRTKNPMEVELGKPLL